MQMASVDTNAGTAICCAPSRMACFNSFFMPKVALDVFNFYSGIVHQYPDRQRQAAQRHDVERLTQRAKHDHGCENRQRN